jgi:hypothetical protein
LEINKRGKAGYNKHEEHKVNKLMKINKRGYINQDVDWVTNTMNKYITGYTDMINRYDKQDIDWVTNTMNKYITGYTDIISKTSIELLTPWKSTLRDIQIW